jgi:CIC family chloride channel protein
LLVVLVVVGGLCGVVAVVFHGALETSFHLMMHTALSLEAPWRWLLVPLMPTLVGGVLAWAVPRFAPEARGGLVLVRTAYSVDPRRLDLRAWLGTFLATPLSLGSGAPLGPEGPTVVLTAGLAAGVGRLLALPSRVVKGMIPVGTAAGIAAIFNTPITAVVFALEEVIGTASRGVLGGAIVAAVAAAVVQKNALGGVHLLPAAPAGWHEAGELIGFAFLGLAAGAVAGVLPDMVRLFRERLQRWSARFPGYETVVRGATAGFAVGLLGLATSDVLGTGYEPISSWLTAQGDARTAGLAFLAKLLAVAVALAAPLVGGFFAPSLFLGASFGSATGHLLQFLFPGAGIDPGAYALVGMGAFFAGFLRTPIASVLIVFELTGDYDLVAPLMLAVALASLVARKVSPLTLVESSLEEAGIYEAETDPLGQVRAREAMTPSPFAVSANRTAREALRLAKPAGHPVMPVVDEQGHCRTLIELESLERAVEEGRGDDSVAQLARAAPVLATPDEPLDRLSHRLGAAGETRCPVVESERHPSLVGFITPGDILRARVRVHEEDSGQFEPLG